LKAESAMEAVRRYGFMVGGGRVCEAAGRMEMAEVAGWAAGAKGGKRRHGYVVHAQRHPLVLISKRNVQER